MASSESAGSYYQRAFNAINVSVLDVYGGILTEEEGNLLNVLNGGLSDGGQRLFIRLYLRKSGWLKRGKLAYEDIGDIDGALNELIEKQLLLSDSASIFDYTELLTLPELKRILSRLQVKLPATLTRSALEALVYEAKDPKQGCISFSSADGRMTLSKQASDKMSILATTTGPIIKIKDEIRSVCDVAMSLYFLVSQNMSGVDDNLSTAILVEINRKSYPKYRIARSGPLFRARSDYDAYQAALALEKELADAAAPLDSDALASFIDKFVESIAIETAAKRSYFLRRFTAGWVQCRILERTAEQFEAEKNYEQAVALYTLLLSQKTFGLGHRGDWWERLVIDLSRHLKKDDAALETCEQAMQDDSVRTASLAALKRRMSKLQQKLALDDDALVQCNDFEQITLYGRIQQESSATGRKLRFHLNDDELDVGSVEDFVLEEFRKDPNGSWDGLHSESSCFTTLFGLLFWDLLFGDNFDDQSDGMVLDVFQTAYQTAPLDLNTDAFYPQRRATIERRLSLIAEDFESAMRLLRMHHLKHHQVSCVGVNWTAFGGEDGLMLLLKVAEGVGGMALSVIMRQFAEDYRHNRSGMPDLILWRTAKDGNVDGTHWLSSSSLILQANDVVFAEVKSTNDRLSDAQRHWISILKGAGMRVLVVRVLDAEKGTVIKRRAKGAD